MVKALSKYLGGLLVCVSVGWFVWAVIGMVLPMNLPLPIYLAILIVSLWLLSYGVRQLRGKKEVAGKWVVLLSVLATGYAIAETESVIHQLLGEQEQDVQEDSGYGYFNGPCAEFDPVRGYRWIQGCHRTVKLNEESLVYDNTFCINNAGVYSSLDYQPRVPNGVKKRYIVLGDSFTAAEFLEKPLTERLNEISEDEVEYYSFALDGGGILNWHHTFFKEIVPTYEFHGLIINVFADDLKRDFFVMNHYPNQGYTSYLKDSPSGEVDFDSVILPKASPYVSYLDDDSLDFAIESFKSQDRLTFVDLEVLKGIILSPVFIYSVFKSKSFLNSVLIDKEVDVSELEAVEYYGAEKWRAINDIISFCKQKNIDVIVSAIPYRHVVGLFNQGKVLKEKKFLELLVEKYKVDYFDGYELFSSYSEEEIKTKYLVGDDHWSQEGSDAFANSLSVFLKDD